MRPRSWIEEVLGADDGTEGKFFQSKQTVSYRHRYQCWACKCTGVLEFEPDVSEPGWTECHHCGIDNEIPPGLHDRPALILGQVPSRVI
jgi:hypothetical protein